MDAADIGELRKSRKSFPNCSARHCSRLGQWGDGQWNSEKLGRRSPLVQCEAGERIEEVFPPLSPTVCSLRQLYFCVYVRAYVCMYIRVLAWMWNDEDREKVRETEKERDHCPAIRFLLPAAHPLASALCLLTLYDPRRNPPLWFLPPNISLSGHKIIGRVPFTCTLSAFVVDASLPAIHPIFPRYNYRELPQSLNATRKSNDDVVVVSPSWNTSVLLNDFE